MDRASNIGERIGRIINELYQGNNSEFARLIGVTESRIRSYLTGSLPKADVLESILEKTAISCEWLLSGRGSMERGQENYTNGSQALSGSLTNQNGYLPATQVIAEQAVPMYDMRLALSDTQLVPHGFVYIPDLPRCDGAIRMYGDQMTPVLKGGDIIVYRKVKDLSREPFWGQIYLLSFEVEGDEHIMVKYIQRSEDEENVKLVSENQKYPPTDIPRSSIKAMAEIKASIRYNTMM